MKTAIIGAGNMGGSIARGLAKGSIIPASDIIVSNPSQGKLDELKVEFPALQITHDNQEAIIGAEFIILAVKPWLIKSVLRELKLKSKHQLRRTGSLRTGTGNDHVPHHSQYCHQRNGKYDFDCQPQCYQRTGATDAGYLQPNGTRHAYP